MTLTWERITSGDWSAGNWAVSDHNDHWHLYWCDDSTYLTDRLLSFDECRDLAQRLQDVLDAP